MRDEKGEAVGGQFRRPLVFHIRLNIKDQRT